MSSLFNSFLVTVGANVVSYYICKWLDSYRKGQVSPKEPPRSGLSEGVRFFVSNMSSPASFLWLSLLYADGGEKSSCLGKSSFLLNKNGSAEAEP